MSKKNNMKTSLSYSSLNQLHEASHQWINKQMGIKVADYPFFKSGKKAHGIIQKHVSGKEKHPLLKHIKHTFPIVEPDMDDNDPQYWDLKKPCKFSFNFGDDYVITGYYDGLDLPNGRILEIKSSSSLWSLGQFRNAVQRKIYGLSNKKIKEAMLITCSKDVDKWKSEKPKVYSVPYTELDYVQAMDWIQTGIDILESGDFTGGLDENGKCTGCLYNIARYSELANCHFL